MGTLLDKPVTEKEDVEHGECNGLKYGVAGMQGWRVDMEDAHVIAERLDEALPDHSLFAVFDGHGGQFAAKYAAKELMDHLRKNEHFQEYVKVPAADRASDESLAKLKEALRRTFVEVDDSMVKTPEMADRRDRSGCTAIAVVVTPTHFLCANAGDSRSVYATGGKTEAGGQEMKTVPLSFDHKPFHPEELTRIDNAGGYVSMKRVDGDLAVSRALGDFQYKDREDLPAEQQKVTCNPDVTVCARTPEDEFVVLACDGIWDVASNEEGTAMVQAILDEGEGTPVNIAEEILDTCLEKGSRDNMTACVILCGGARIAETGGGVASRREKRAAAAREKEIENTPVPRV